MPQLIRLYIVCVATGFGISALFLAAMLWQDVAGLQRLILGSDSGFVAALMLFVFQGVLFGGVQFAITIMSMGQDDPDQGKMIPIRVTNPTKRQ